MRARQDEAAGHDPPRVLTLGTPLDMSPATAQTATTAPPDPPPQGVRPVLYSCESLQKCPLLMAHACPHLTALKNVFFRRRMDPFMATISRQYAALYSLRTKAKLTPPERQTTHPVLGALLPMHTIGISDTTAVSPIARIHTRAKVEMPVHGTRNRGSTHAHTPPDAPT